MKKDTDLKEWLAVPRFSGWQRKNDAVKVSFFSFYDRRNVKVLIPGDEKIEIVNRFLITFVEKAFLAMF